MKFNLAKLHSSGNSFVVCLMDGLEMPKTRIADLCDPRYGLGGDGLVWIESHENSGEYQLRFYNNNGSQFRMCFNGSLCAALFLKLCQNSNNLIQLHVPEFGTMEAGFSGETTSLRFPVPLIDVWPEKTENDAFPGECYSVAMTDNHKVLLTQTDPLPLDGFIPAAKSLRMPSDYFPEGANVHFVSVGSHALHIRHFEKGIENETLSCGSGCVAAALVLKERKELEFISPGGKLKIQKKEADFWIFSGQPKLIAWLKLPVTNQSMNIEPLKNN